MEGYVGEIRLFAASFAPLNWQYCQGQTLSVRSSTALFAILGTQYGGDGSQTFQLPNLAGRVVVGSGQGPGLSGYTNGQMGGVQAVPLTSAQMPAHLHSMVVQQQITGVAAVACAIDSGGTASPDDALISGDGNSTVFTSNQTTVAMSPKSVTGSNFTLNAPTVTGVSATGGGSAHNNMQPYLGLGYIICVQGNFPSRD
jgi:microcystin-dependent protein